MANTEEQLPPDGEQQTQEPEPVVAFVHIPKTAGGTLKMMLGRAYGRDSVHDAGNYLRNPEKTASAAARHSPKMRVTIGHTPYGLFTPPSAARDPLHHVPPRARSNASSRTTTGTWPTRTESLGHALEAGMPHVTNLMTRYLCSEATTGALPDSALEEAKANLETFTFVGFQDRFDESVVLLQEALGLPMIPYGSSKHVNTERPSLEQVGEQERAAIVAGNQLDIALFEWARGRFYPALEASDSEFRDKVVELRNASQESATAQQERVEIALNWLTEALPPGTERSFPELLAEAAAEANITKPDLKAAKRRIKPRCEVRRENGNLFWVRGNVRAKQKQKQKHRAGAPGAES